MVIFVVLSDRQIFNQLYSMHNVCLGSLKYHLQLNNYVKEDLQNNKTERKHQMNRRNVQK